MGSQPEAVAKEYGIDLAEFSLYFSAKSPHAMAAVEGKTYIVRYVNNAFEKLIRKKRTEILNLAIENSLPGGKENACMAALDRAYSTSNAEILPEQEHTNMPGVYWSYYVWPITGPDGHPVGVLIEVTDTSESAIFKKRLREANQQLLVSSVQQNQLSEKFEQTAKELQFKNEELESIIGIFSHDLRSPLVNIKGFNNFVKQDISNIEKLLAGMKIPEQIRTQLDFVFQKSIPESTGFIESSAEAMNTLIKSLIDIARLGLAVLKPERLEMNEVVREIVGNLGIKSKQAGAQIHIENLPPCRGDRVQVTGIFSNLIDNAVKYLDPDRAGQIRVSGKIQQNRVVYCVEDNGIGIAPEDQGRVFEIFTRLAQKAHAGGEGMGLTMVKRMVDRNDGQIWVESEKNKGSKFFVSLPMP
jgi:signal transduction histidine kinase